MADTNIIMLALLAAVLVAYMVRKQSASGKKQPTAEIGPVGNSKRKPPGVNTTFCKNVPIDSPDFARCAQSLGTGRSVLPGNPKKTANNINTNFVSSEYAPVGNPFSSRPEASYVNKDYGKLGETSIANSTRPISKAGSQAFPFSQKGSDKTVDFVNTTSVPSTGFRPTPPPDGPGVKFLGSSSKKPTFVEAPARGTSRPSVTVGSTHEGVKFNKAFLGAAVSPSSHDALGASPEEIAQSAQKLDNVDKVSKNSGGQLNLLVHGR